MERRETVAPDGGIEMVGSSSSVVQGVQVGKEGFK